MNQWDEVAVENHIKAGKELVSILRACEANIRKNKQISERWLTDFVLAEFNRRGLKTDEPPMVAFGRNTNKIHYIAPIRDSQILGQETLIMIDLWAGLRQFNAPMADITWMYYWGNNPPEKLIKDFKAVVKVRNNILAYIRELLTSNQSPLGKDIDKFRELEFAHLGYNREINNYTGHMIGFSSPHGIGGNLNRGSEQPLKPMVGYTLEPELDFEDYGIRLELDFFIDNNLNLILTTPKQISLTKLI